MVEWESIVQAIQIALTGDRRDGKALLDQCWAETTSDEHAKRCVLAHYLADLQDDLASEIRWDESALKDYEFVGDGDLAAIGIQSTAGLGPSLHLNLGDGYLRRGDSLAARNQLEAGLACVSSLADDGYSTMIRNGLLHLQVRLNEHDA